MPPVGNVIKDIWCDFWVNRLIVGDLNGVSVGHIGRRIFKVIWVQYVEIQKVLEFWVRILETNTRGLYFVRHFVTKSVKSPNPR